MATAEHPLVRSLREVGELDPYLDMPVASADDAGWSPAAALFQAGDASLREMVMGYGYARWRTTNNHVAASAFIIAYLTRFIFPTVGQYVLKRRVPKVTLENLAFHRTNGRIDATGLRQPRFAVLPDDPAAGHPDAAVLASETDLYRQLKDWAFKSNVEIVIETLRRSVPASVKVSRNAVAASCSQALHRLYSRVEDKSPVLSAAEVLFGDPSSLVYGQVSMEVIDHAGKSGFFARRAGCCLVWRTREDNGYCSNCILQPREEQTRQFKELLERVN